MTRENASAKIEAVGGKVNGSVIGTSNFILAGAEAGSKMDKAQKKLGLKMINESEFMKMFRVSGHLR